MNSKFLALIGMLLLGVMLVSSLATPALASGVVLSSEEVDIDGTLEKVFLRDDGTIKAITVGMDYIFFDGDTEVDGVLKPGADVEVRAELRDGKLFALKVESDVDELEGTVMKSGFLGGFKFLKVCGVKVFIDDEVRVTGGLPIPGAEVKITVEFRDGRQFADRIEVLSMPTAPVHPMMPRT